MYDIIVVGGGAAGMTAALYALRNNKKVLVVEKEGFGGQITHSPKVENFPGTQQMSGNEFAEQLFDQIMAQGAEIELAAVTGVKDEGEVKHVLTDDGGDFTCRAVILAAGVEHRMLGLPGEEELVGNGISFCAVCDGAFYKDRTVAMAGGGNSALQEVLLLAENCKEVIVVQNLDFFTGEKRLVEAMQARPNVRTILGTVIDGYLQDENGLTGLKLRDTHTGETSDLPVDGLFVAVGLEPKNNAAFRDVAPLNEQGYFAADETCLTGRDGIYVAGDCRSKSIRQLTTACADGAVAALAACRYLDLL